MYDDLRRAGELSARVHYSLLVAPGFMDKDADRFDAVRRAHPDTPYLKLGVIKLFADGVIETNTAFMLAPYDNDPSTRGTPNYSREELDRIVQMMDRRGWQIMIHGLGDGAVRMVLDAFERAAAVNPAPARGRQGDHDDRGRENCVSRPTLIASLSKFRCRHNQNRSSRNGR